MELEAHLDSAVEPRCFYPVMQNIIFPGSLLAGFECSTHRRLDGRRLDMIAATEHDRFARADYARLAASGIGIAREGLRWHLIEQKPAVYDFASALDQLRAAEEHKIRVIWDLFHYGLPDHIDIFSKAFVERFANFSEAFARFHIAETGRAPWIVAINEISFFSWIAGDVGQFFPYAQERAPALKRNLVRAAAAAIRVVKDCAPGTVSMTSEPLVHVTCRPEEPWNSTLAAAYNEAQFEAVDMLLGNRAPELGGSPDLVDLVGLNYYPHNQWTYPDREMIAPGDEGYKELSALLHDAQTKLAKPLFISETGTEGDERARWFGEIMSQCKAARGAGVDLRGVCIYPILNHPGWDDERHCPNGLWGYADATGARDVEHALLEAVRSVPGERRSTASA